MIIERDVAVPVRGGVTVYADVFRPTLINLWEETSAVGPRQSKPN